jgi:hypothetical protein
VLMGLGRAGWSSRRGRRQTGRCKVRQKRAVRRGVVATGVAGGASRRCGSRSRRGRCRRGGGGRTRGRRVRRWGCRCGGRCRSRPASRYPSSPRGGIDTGGRGREPWVPVVSPARRGREVRRTGGGGDWGAPGGRGAPVGVGGEEEVPPGSAGFLIKRSRIAWYGAPVFSQLVDLLRPRRFGGGGAARACGPGPAGPGHGHKSRMSSPGHVPR